MRRAVAVLVALLLALVATGPARADGAGDLPPPPPPPSAPPPAPPTSPPPPSGTGTGASGTSSSGATSAATPSSGNSSAGSAAPATTSSAPAPAAAPPPSQPPPPPPSSAPRQGSWGDVGFFLQKTAGGTFLALSPITGTRLQLVGPVWAEGLWGMTLALGIGSNSAGEDMAIGNPYVGLDYVAHTPGMTLVAGGGLTLPLAQGGLPITYAVSEGMRARWDPWIWAQQRMALVAKARARFQRPGGLTFAGEAGVGYLLWLGAGTAPGLLDVQVAGEVGYRPTPLFSFGLRMTAVAGQPVGSNDLLQLGAEPYLRIHGGGQMYEIRLTLPLDGPYGFGFAPGGVWGIEVGGGIEY